MNQVSVSRGAVNQAQISLFKQYVESFAFENTALADLTEYFIEPYSDYEFHSSLLQHELIEKCYLKSTKLIFYAFDARYSKALTMHGRSGFDAVYIRSRLEKQFPTAGYCTIVELRSNYIFVSTRQFILSRCKGLYKVLPVNTGRGPEFIYNGVKLYLKTTGGGKFWEYPVNEISYTVIVNARFPYFSNIVLSCFNHFLGPGAHFFKDVVKYSNNVWFDLKDIMSIPLTLKGFKNNRNKVKLLRHTKGIVGRFSSRLPFNRAVIFVLATKHIIKTQYDCLINAYRMYESLQGAVDYHDLLVHYYAEKFRIRTIGKSNIKRDDHLIDNDESIISDYIKIVIGMKDKVDLNISSLKRLNELHVRLSLRLEVDQLSVHEDFESVSSADLELIKTPERLIEEGMQQRHCVASYADLINDGDSGIYSTVYLGNRYTVELVRGFTCTKEKKWVSFLAIEQIRGFANREAPQEVHSIIARLVAQANETLRDKIHEDEMYGDDDLPF